MRPREINSRREAARVALAAFVLLTSGSAATVQASESGRVPSWVSAPVERDRHTTLLARFDDRQSVQPDYERDGTGAAGRNYDASVPGRHGGGIEIDVPGAQLNFRSHGNLHPQAGTVQFWIRSKPGENIWKDGNEHCLFSAAAEQRVLELWKKDDNRLHLRWAGFHWKGDGEVPGDLSVPVQDLDGEAWHHVLFSWDDEAGRLWLAVNGRLQNLDVGEPLSVGHFHIFFLGSSYYGGVGQTGLDPTAVFQTAGAHFDELKISDVTVEQLQALHGEEGHLPEAQALAAQDAVCRHLDFISRLQIDGAWSAILYAWPHLLPGMTSYRTFFEADLDRYVEVTHNRNGTPGAGRLFLYAYQVLGDRRYLEVAEKAGEWMLAAQQPEGYWSTYYERHTGGPPTPRTGVTTSHRRTYHREDPTFEDRRQTEAAMLMADLYRATGEDKWLEALRRSADFHLLAQNPNGSWGYRYNLREKRSENRNQDPHGAGFGNSNQRNPMIVLLVAYQVTGEAKYLEALRRAGDWHLNSQLGPPTYGWAFQTDADNNPVWARVYHPPGLVGGNNGISALFFMYDLTGDRKYLQTIRPHIEWEKSAVVPVEVDGEEVPMRGQLVDYKTGSPMAVDLKTWTIHHLDEPEDRAAFVRSGGLRWTVPDADPEGEFPWHLYMQRPSWPRLEPELERRLQDERPQPIRLTRDELAESVSDYVAEELGEVTGEQNGAGVWPKLVTWEAGAQGSYNIGSYFVLVDHRAYAMLSLLERSKILAGAIDRDIWRFPSFIQESDYPMHYRNWMDLSRQ